MKKYLAAFLVLSAIFGGVSQARAVTFDDLWNEITSLKAEIVDLKSQISAQVISGARASVSAPVVDVRADAAISAYVPVAVEKAVITKTLQKGTTDKEVTVLQTVLKNEGYLKEEVTGYYGRATETAVKEYQAAKGLEVTGSVGPRTRATLATTPITNMKPSDALSIMAESAGCVGESRVSASTGKPCPGNQPAMPVRRTTESPVKNTLACSASGYMYSGKFGSFGSGNGQFDMPYEIDADASGNIYVPDTHNNTVQKFDSNGNFILKFGSAGSGNGQLDRPYGLGVDASGNVYVADTYNSRIQKFSSSGTYISQFGSGTLNHPGAVKFDQGGNIYVTDIDNRRVAKFDATGNLLLTFGSAGTGNGQFTDLRGIAIAPNGNVYVVDNGNANRVQVFNSNGVYLNQFGTKGSGYGQFNNPADLHFDSNGNLYVVEAHGNRIQKFNANGTYIGQFGSQGSGNGQISYPLGMTIDASNNMYVSDWKNSRIVKFSPCSQSIPLTAPVKSANDNPFAGCTATSKFSATTGKPCVSVTSR